MADGWYYVDIDKTFEPLDLKQMQAVLSKVADPRNVLVWKTGLQNWERAKNVREIAALISPPLPKETSTSIGRTLSKREQYFQAKQHLSEITQVLDTASLTPQERYELQLHTARLAGVLCRPWLPVTWGRRLIMAGIILFGLHQAWTGNPEHMLWWLLLPLFSPHIMGQCFFNIGRMKRLLNQGNVGGVVQLVRFVCALLWVSYCAFKAWQTWDLTDYDVWGGTVVSGPQYWLITPIVTFFVIGLFRSVLLQLWQLLQLTTRVLLWVLHG
jgi:hypothetical protein